MKESKLHFQRIEFKYILNKKQYYEIKHRLLHFFDHDAFSSHEGTYEVISLYFDSPLFYYYAEKIDGVKRRKKIRLRTYRHEGNYANNLFLEIKRKHDAVVLKDRILLSQEDYHQLLSDHQLKLSAADDSQRSNVVNELHLESSRLSLEPQVLVAYTREPYLGTFDKNTRITFDYDIKARMSKTLYDGEKERNCDVSEGRVIMEVKFRQKMPEYVAQIIAEYNLGRVPYSKYCEGLEACYSLPLLSFVGRTAQSDTLALKRDQLLV